MSAWHPRFALGMLGPISLRSNSDAAHDAGFRVFVNPHHDAAGASKAIQRKN